MALAPRYARFSARQALARIGRCISWGCPPSVLPDVCRVTATLTRQWPQTWAHADGFYQYGHVEQDVQTGSRPKKDLLPAAQQKDHHYLVVLQEDDHKTQWSTGLAHEEEWKTVLERIVDESMARPVVQVLEAFIREKDLHIRPVVRKTKIHILNQSHLPPKAQQGSQFAVFTRIPTTNSLREQAIDTHMAAAQTHPQTASKGSQQRVPKPIPSVAGYHVTAQGIVYTRHQKLPLATATVYLDFFNKSQDVRIDDSTHAYPNHRRDGVVASAGHAGDVSGGTGQGSRADTTADGRATTPTSAILEPVYAWLADRESALVEAYGRPEGERARVLQEAVDGLERATWKGGVEEDLGTRLGGMG